MSLFSDFIRNATPEEKRAVYMDVMERATERQKVAVRGEVTGRHDSLEQERLAHYIMTEDWPILRALAASDPPQIGAWPDNPTFPAGWDERDAKGV